MKWYAWLGVTFLVVFGGIALYVDIREVYNLFKGGMLP